MKFLLTVIFLSVLGVVAADAQTVAATTCRTKTFSFACPENATVFRSGKEDGTFVAFHDKAKVGLFAQEIGDKTTDDKSLNELLEKAFQVFYSAGVADSALKDSRDFWGDQRYSKFEEKKYSKVALIKPAKELVHLHLAVISFEGKRILAGFTRTIMKGDGAEGRFESWIGGGGSGDRELHELLKAITKEEDPRELPGGPPPAKKPPTEIPGGPPPVKKP